MTNERTSQTEPCCNVCSQDATVVIRRRYGSGADDCYLSVCGECSAALLANEGERDYWWLLCLCEVCALPIHARWRKGDAVPYHCEAHA